MSRVDAAWKQVEGVAQGMGGVDLRKASADEKALADAVSATEDDIDGRIAMESIRPKLDAFTADVAQLQQKYGLRNQGGSGL